MARRTRVLSVAFVFALVVSLMFTTVAFADGTVTDPDYPNVQTTSGGDTQYGFGSSSVWVPAGAGDVSVAATPASLSPTAPANWEYAANSISVALPSGALLGKYVVLCWAVPAGAENVQIFRLNQYGGWEAAPTVFIRGSVCTGTLLTGTFAPFVPASN